MLDNSAIRQMPYSIEAEQAILGTLITDPEKFDEIPFLKADDFYLEQHRAIYDSLSRMLQVNRKVDLVTLLDELAKLDVSKETDSTKYIKLLVESAAYSKNIVEHANIVRDKAVLRNLIDVSKEISEDAYSASEDIDVIVDRAEQKIFEISNNKYTANFSHISEAIKEDFELLERRANDPESLEGINTHYKELDELVRMGPGDLVIVGARPGMGKTSFCMNIAANVAKTPRKDGTMPEVAIFSLEMTRQQLAERLLSSEALVESNSLLKGRLNAEAWKKLADAASRLSSTQLLIDENPNISVSEMKAKLRRLKNLGLVVIDYLQLMRSDRKIDNQVLLIADITRNLKLMAKSLGVPIILCSQLRRDSNKNDSKIPQLSDLRDSGAIEQDADVVIFLHRDDYGKYDEEEKGDGIPMAKAVVAKNRHGATGHVDFSWYGANFKFVAVERRYGE